MAERRSGVDLLYCSAGWAVVYGGRLLELHQTREEAIRAARAQSERLLSERAGSAVPLDPAEYPRLRSRRRVRHQHGYLVTK